MFIPVRLERVEINRTDVGKSSPIFPRFIPETKHLKKVIFKNTDASNIAKPTTFVYFMNITSPLVLFVHLGSLLFLGIYFIHLYHVKQQSMHF